MRCLRCFALLLPLAVAGCLPYALVKPDPTPVAGRKLEVHPTTPWNKMPSRYYQARWEELWTKNGPLLDTVTFISAMPEGKALVPYESHERRQAPAFRVGMSPDDLVSMIEGSYRVKGVDVFEVTLVEPTTFLGAPAIRVDFAYVMDDRLPRKGRSVMTIVDDRFYMIKLEGAASHYFDASALEFDQMVETATLR